MKYLPSKEIAKLVRSELKKEFGKTAKFSVRKHDFAGGREITVTIKKASEKYFKPLNEFEEEYAEYKVNDPSFYEGVLYRFNRHDELALTDEFMDKVKEIVDKWNWCESDPYTDYYNVNYYTSVTGREIEVI